jgi:zinc/manganese transport system permease protein
MIIAAWAAMLLWVWPHNCAGAQSGDNSGLEALRAAALADINSDIAHDPNDIAQPPQIDDSNGIFNFFAMQICLLAVVLVLHTYTGIHIIRRGIIFSDLVLDQLAAFGIVVGIALGIKYGTPASYLMAFGATLIGCILLAVIQPKNKLIPQEAVIGVMYGMALVASLLLADKLPTGSADLKNTLEGSMSWVSWPLVAITAAIYIALLIFHYIFRKTIIGYTESDKISKERRLWDFLFFLSQGIITILIVPVAGVLLAYGFLMIPAAIGVMFTKDWKKSLLAGWSCGMIACTIGIIFSYKTDSPYGPSLMLSMGTLFLAALFIHRAVSFIKRSRS